MESGGQGDFWKGPRDILVDEHAFVGTLAMICSAAKEHASASTGTRLCSQPNLQRLSRAIVMERLPLWRIISIVLVYVAVNFTVWSLN
jgi:hypothetical protein